MSKESLLKSLFIPVITAAASIIITAAGVLVERHMFTLILGLVFGGNNAQN